MHGQFDVIRFVEELVRRPDDDRIHLSTVIGKFNNFDGKLIFRRGRDKEVRCKEKGFPDPSGKIWNAEPRQEMTVREILSGKGHRHTENLACITGA